MQKALGELVDRLKAAGVNLKSVILYGSAADGEFHEKHSDLNVLAVLEKLDARSLADLEPASAWWVRKGHPAPLVFTREEIERSADVFAIEFLDIKNQHRLLYGEDPFANLEVPMHLHHLQVERELRQNLVRLRQHFLTGPTTLRLMTGSVSSFTTLFRHALIALGEPAPGPRRDAVGRLAELLSFDPSGFHEILELRAGEIEAAQIHVKATFALYLEAVARVTEEVDRRLEARR